MLLLSVGGVLKAGQLEYKTRGLELIPAVYTQFSLWIENNQIFVPRPFEDEVRSKYTQLKIFTFVKSMLIYCSNFIDFPPGMFDDGHFGAAA